MKRCVYLLIYRTPYTGHPKTIAWRRLTVKIKDQSPHGKLVRYNRTCWKRELSRVYFSNQMLTTQAFVVIHRGIENGWINDQYTIPVLRKINIRAESQHHVTPVIINKTGGTAHFDNVWESSYNHATREKFARQGIVIRHHCIYARSYSQHYHDSFVCFVLISMKSGAAVRSSLE